MHSFAAHHAIHRLALDVMFDDDVVGGVRRFGLEVHFSPLDAIEAINEAVMVTSPVQSDVNESSRSRRVKLSQIMPTSFADFEPF